MIYTIEKASLIAKQLKKFTSGFTHHLAGHYSNIDFWLQEAKDAIITIDQHNYRFDVLYNAQKNWVTYHGSLVHEYCRICNGKCEFSTGIPSLPSNRSKSEKILARRELVDSIYYFLARCYNVGLLNLEQLKEYCDQIGTSIDPNDLRV